MKIKQEHLDHLKKTIGETVAKYNSNGKLVKAYQSGDFHNSDKTKDLQKRFCFDLLHGSGLTKWVCQTLYPYMDDSHLYTALKSVCPIVQRNY